MYKVKVEIELNVNTNDRIEAAIVAADIVKSFNLDFVKIRDVCKVNDEVLTDDL